MKKYTKSLHILYEDNHIIAVNKKVGDLVQADKTEDKPLSEIVKEYIKNKYDKKGNVFLGVTHRLDRPTTGIVIFAKTSKALIRLNEMFKNHEIQKIYWALVKHKPEQIQEKLTHYIKRNTKNNTSKSYIKEVPDSKKAVLEYKLLQSLDNYHLLEIELHTGRHHQIRSQLSAIGNPIKGDLKYGFLRSNPNGGINLHARKVIFIHPVSKEKTEIIADLPNENLWEKIQCFSLSNNDQTIEISNKPPTIVSETVEEK